LAFLSMNPIELEEGEAKEIPRQEMQEGIARIIYENYGSQISVDFPTMVKDRYTLKSQIYVGQIPISDECRLIINPKVSISNIFQMLEYAYDLRPYKPLGIIEFAAIDDLFETLAQKLAQLILNRVRKGLYRGYLQEQDYLPYVRGRINIAKTLQSMTYGSVNLCCEFEEHTADLDDNRILTWTLYCLRLLQFKHSEAQQYVRKAYRALIGSITVEPKNALDCIGRIYHRLNYDYRPMHGLCRFFLEHLGPGLESGKYEFLPFLLHMPNLYEVFVATWLKEHVPPYINVETQKKNF